VSSDPALEALLVGQDAAVDGVRDPSFQAAPRFLDRVVLGDFASIVIAARAGIAGLGDGRDVDGGVELPVASPG
jgi:hypothetical protein